MSAHSVFCKKLGSKGSFFYGLCIVCVCLVAANIIYSQKYNVYMYGVMDGKSESITSYLRHIWGTPLFNLEMEIYQKEGRDDILSQWADIQHKNTDKIHNLENATLIYPYSPELYYNLYLLYSENGEKAKAINNLRKAQHIDPTIGR